MPAATPTLATVITAVATAIDAVNPASGTVLESDLKTESEREGLETYQQSDGAIDLWIVRSEDPRDVEGEGLGEQYALYPVVCVYTNVRVNDADWEKTGRAQVETIRDALNQNASIFRIGGQIQIAGTPETASVESQGFEDVEGMLVFRAVVRLTVEARRWA